MDAVSAASAIVALVFHCATVVKACDELRSKWKNAEQTLRSIATEGSTLRASLLQLQHLMMRDPAALSSRWDVESMLPQTFETAISSFNTVIDTLLREMKKFDIKSTWSGSPLTQSLKFRVLWNENIMQDLLVHLRAHQQSLQFLMTILQMGSLSEIRHGIRKNERLLRTIARATKRLDQPESLHAESLKRKECRREETKSRSLPPEEEYKSDNNETDSDDEPPAKRRSLSPEKDVFSHPSPARTRSGMTYRPDTTEIQLVSPKIYNEVKDVRWGTEKPTISASAKGKRQDTTYESYCHQSTQQRHWKMKHKGGNDRRRSHSSPSSPLAFPTPPGSFAKQTKIKDFPKSTPPNQKHSDPQTPPDTPDSGYREHLTCNKTGGEVDSQTRKQVSTSHKSTPAMPNKSFVESDDGMEDFKVEPTIYSNQSNSKSQVRPSSSKSSQRPKVKSDSEDESDQKQTARVTRGQSSKKPTLNTPPPKPKATEEDARKHRIPPGYSLKNWDPSEEPIMLLGSVFDANSLGRWIFDWTVYHHGSATPIADMAGELWLLLIQLAGKAKRAEECQPRIRKEENKEMIEDFLESGERLMDKLNKLLKCCETPMLNASRRNGMEKGQAQLGENAGIEFVDSIFGKERQLEQTEKFMASVRLWNLRFDANCEDILRRPGQ